MEFGEVKRNTSNWSNFCMLPGRAGLSVSARLSCYLTLQHVFICLWNLDLSFCEVGVSVQNLWTYIFAINRLAVNRDINHSLVIWPTCSSWLVLSHQSLGATKSSQVALSTYHVVSPRGTTFSGGATAVGFLANQETGRIVQGCCFGPNWCERCRNTLSVNPIKRVDLT